MPTWNKGKTKEDFAQMANSGRKKGCVGSNMGRTFSDEWRENLSKSHLGYKYPPDRVAWNKGKTLTKEHIRKALGRRIPTSLEEKFQNIVSKYHLPYKYVGDGSFIIGHCNPDFINTNSKKIAIEVYARYYKLRHSMDIEGWKEKRAEIFRKFGWTVIYFDETQVTEDYILSTLRNEKCWT